MGSDASIPLEHSTESGLPPDPTWIGVRELPVLFANHIWAQFVDNQFIVTFGHVELPYEPTEVLREHVRREGIEIIGVVRLAMGADQLKTMVDVLSGLVTEWEQRKQN